MNTKTILATVALLALAGCSSTKIEGTGEFFQGSPQKTENKAR